MTLPEDRPNVTERYSSALNSSHLEVTPDKRGDVDMLIASGWARESLGTQLYRLRVEFDSINQIELAAVGHSLTAKLMTLNKLQTLRPTMVQLGAFAQMTAARRGLQETEEAIHWIAGRCLDAWISPLCHHCGGRGFNGGMGAPRLLCTHCSGTGKRRPKLARTVAGHDFGRSLLGHMDAKTERVAKAMRRFLSQQTAPAKKDGAKSETEALRQRLALLRSTEAQAD